MNSVDPSLPPADSSDPAPDAPKPWSWKRTARFLVGRVVFWYAVICVIVMAMQRQLIYHPQRLEKITSAESPLPTGCIHDFDFETEDGLALNGWHVLRTGKNCESPEETQEVLKEARWLVLFFHGNAGDRRGRVDYSQVFNGAGADVFLMDYRGYADNPGSPHEAGLAKDARGLWKYATETRGVNPNRIVLFGESLGGGVAVRLAQEVCQAGTPPAALILRSTFTSLVDVGSHHYPWLPVRLLLWDRFPSSERIADVTCPVLILHGTQDRIIPYQFGEKLFEAAPDRAANNLPKRFVSIEGADHNRLLLTHEREFAEAIDEFIAELPKSDPEVPFAE